MQKPDESNAHAHLALAERWRRLRVAYRFANRASHHLLGFTLKLALLIYFLFAITFLVLRYAILPNIDYYKGDIERLSSRALGNQVAISRIYASWRGLRPNLFLGDVQLRDKQGRHLLSLPSVSATLSWWSVLALEVRFESLEVTRPDLDVLRAPDGMLYVAGIALDPKKGDGQGADWALRQREVVIRQGRLRWTDQLRGAPELALENVNVVLRNRWNEHQLGVQATPPAALSQPIDLRADFVHPRFATRISNVALWKGELYADVRGTDLAGWKAYLDYPFELNTGRGSVRAWLSLDHAKLAGFTADVGLADVTARLGKDLPPLDLARVTGRLSAREEIVAGVEDGTPTFGMHGHSVTLTDFALDTRDGLSLPPTTLSESYSEARRGRPEQLQVGAKLVDLATMAELAAQLPMTPNQRQMLADLAPRGQLRDFTVQLEGRYPAIASYRVKGQVQGLGLRAQAARAPQPKSASAPAQAGMPPIPGFENLTGSVEATEVGGSFTLDSSKLVLHMPAYFSDPDMPFDALNMRARWSFERNNDFLFQVDEMHFAQGMLKGSLAGRHRIPLGAHGKAALGSVDFDGSLTGFEVSKLDRFLPAQTPSELRQWLTGALEDGIAQDVTVKLRGELAQFPFRADTPAERARGEFRVAGRIENGKLNYVPGRLSKDGKAPWWPQAEKIDGTILFDRTRMEIKGNTARTAGVALASVKAVVPDLAAHDMMLDIDGSAAGPMQEFLRYVAVSPVLDWIGRFTEDTRASGNAKLALKLHIPLNHAIDAKVQGSLQLLGDDVVLFNDLPPLQATQGRIDFNERGVALNGLGASFLGGPLAVTGGSQRDGSIVIKLGGTLAADGLRKSYPSAAMQRVASHMSGAARYSGTIVVKDRQTQVTIDSNLVGLGLDFPAPVKKAAAEALPLRFTQVGAVVNEAGVCKDELKLTLGSAIGARYLRQKNGKAPWTVLRGGIGVNMAVPEPDAGVMITASMKSLNVDQWTSLGSVVTTGGKADPARDGPDLSQYIVPDTMAARATELIIGERKLDNVVVGASRQKNVWQANVDAKQVSGYFTWSEAPGGQGAGKVTARLSSLIIPESAAAEVKDLLEGAKGASAPIPALDVVAERFELFNKQLGRLELAANNAPLGQGREWRVSKLQLTNPDADFKGTGKWGIKDGQSSTNMNFTLDIVDAGKLLDRLGFPETLRRGKGKLTGDVAWNGLPYSLDIPSMSGQIQMNVEAGQFLKKDPGAAKLLGVLSLQALPHLLKLDFHDVFSDGLAFDGITASAVIQRGVLKTENLKMHGVAATVLMDGSADIANETTNLHVVVIPEFNLGTGSLMYLAVNPVIGVSTLLAQLFLRAPVMKALTYQMQVTGPWKAPIVTKLDNGKIAPLPPGVGKQN